MEHAKNNASRVELTKEAEKILKKLIETTGKSEGYILSNLLENLEKIGRRLIKTENEERTWNTWILSESDIQEVAKQNELSLEGRDMDEIARLYEKGISAMLGNGMPDWTDILKEAIQYTEPEAQEE